MSASDDEPREVWRPGMTRWRTINPTGRCPFDMCMIHRPRVTHVVKWPIEDYEAQRRRTYTCRRHAAEIVDYQRSTGTDVRAYGLNRRQQRWPR